MPMPPNFFKTSKSESPVTRCEQPESSAAARIRLSSASRQTEIAEVTLTNSVCRSTKKVSKRACRGENPNFARSFSEISSRMSCEAINRHWLRAARHKRRQKPSAVKIASQTLLSSTTRTGQGENFLFGQAVFAGQRIESGQGAIQFAFRRKKIFIDALNLLVGQPLNFFNDLACTHAFILIARAQKSKG